MKHVRTPAAFRGIVALLSLVLISLPFSWVSPHAQGISRSVSRQDREKLQTIAASLAARAEGAELLITRLHLDSRMTATWPQWRQWPAVRIIEAAYSGANAAQPGTGGDLVLRYAANIIADEFSASIRGEAALHEFFAMGSVALPASESDVPFVKPRLDPVHHLPSAKVREVISVIAKHASRIPGGVPELVRDCCQLQEAEAYEIERSADSVEEAISRAITLKGAPPPEEVKAWRAIKWVAAWNGAMVHDEGWREYANLLRDLPGSSPARVLQIQSVVIAALQQFGAPPSPDRIDIGTAAAKIVDNAVDKARRAKSADNDLAPKSASAERDQPLPTGMGRNVPPTNPGHGKSPLPPQPPAPNGGVGLASTDLATARYNDFVQGEYRTNPDGPKLGGGGGAGFPIPFDVMRTFEGGFGGVIFGADVGSSPSLPKPTILRWVPYDQAASRWGRDIESWGYLEFQFADGTSGRSEIMPADHARVAYDLLWGNNQYQRGQGFGLVGFVGRVSHLVAWNNSVIGRERGANFIVNPIVLHSRIGRALMILDLMGYDPTNWGTSLAPDLVAEAYSAGANDNQANTILEWRDSVKGNYKFVDVPILVTRLPDGMMVTTRQQLEDETLPESLLSSAFIDMQSFDEGDKALSRDPAKFYNKVPLFISVSAEFDRVNDFAAQFALLRWAKDAGAEWRGAAPVATSLPAQSAVLFGWKGTEFLPSADVLLQDLILSTERESLRLLGTDASEQGTTLTKKLTKARFESLEYSAALEILGGERGVIRRAAVNDPAIKIPDDLSDNCPDTDSIKADDPRRGIPEWRALSMICSRLTDTREPDWEQPSEVSEYIVKVLDIVGRSDIANVQRQITAAQDNVETTSSAYDEASQQLHDVQKLDRDDEQAVRELRLSWSSEAQRAAWDDLQKSLDSANASLSQKASKAPLKSKMAERARIQAKIDDFVKTLPPIPSVTDLETEVRDKRASVAAAEQTANDLSTKLGQIVVGSRFEAWVQLQEAYESANVFAIN